MELCLVSQVYYWRESSRLPWHTVSRRIKTKSFKANGPRLSGTLSGLVPYSNYRIYIVVANNRFEGPPSHTIEFQTPEGGMKLFTQLTLWQIKHIQA